MNANTNPLASLKSTETSLTNAIDRATSLADEIGTTALDEAVDRFREAVGGAKDRLSAAALLVRSIASGLVEDLIAFGCTIDADLAANAVPQLGHTPPPANAIEPSEPPTPSTARRTRKTK